jgi:hypothetical protein
MLAISHVMASEKNEEMTPFSSRLPRILNEAFDATVKKGTVKQHVFNAAIRLWVSLPEEYRRGLVDAESADSPQRENSLVEIINRIVDARFQQGQKDGRRSGQTQNQASKRGQKD